MFKKSTNIEIFGSIILICGIVALIGQSLIVLTSGNIGDFLNTIEDINIIKLLLVTSIIVFLAYITIEYGIVMQDYQNASDLVNKYLAIMSIQGMLTEDAKNNLREELDNVGLELLNIRATETMTLRDIRDPESSKLYLQIAVVPKARPLLIGHVLKTDNPDTPEPLVPDVAEDVNFTDTEHDKFKIVVGGEILSEKVYPD